MATLHGDNSLFPTLKNSVWSIHLLTPCFLKNLLLKFFFFTFIPANRRTVTWSLLVILKVIGRNSCRLQSWANFLTKYSNFTSRSFKVYDCFSNVNAVGWRRLCLRTHSSLQHTRLQTHAQNCQVHTVIVLVKRSVCLKILVNTGISGSRLSIYSSNHMKKEIQGTLKPL